jgi:hypothetical protein
VTTVSLPLRVRIPAYVTSAVTALAGTPTVTYLAAEHIIDTPTTVWLGVLIAGIHIGADALALSHLTLPESAGDQISLGRAVTQAQDAYLAAGGRRTEVATAVTVSGPDLVRTAAAKPAAKAAAKPKA